MRNVNFARLIGGVCLAALSPLAFSGPVAAQDAPGMIPGLGNFSLPASQPTPTPTPTPGPPPLVPPVSVTPSVTPRPVPTPTPTPRPSPSAPAITLPTLRPAPTPTPRPPVARPAPTATLTPATVATPEPVETPPTTPSPMPLPTETPVATIAPPAESGLPIWLIPAALVGLAVLIGGVIFLRRRRAEDAWEEPVAYVPPEPEPQPAPDPLPPVAPQHATPAGGPAPRFLTPPPPPAPVVLPSSLTIEAPSVRRAGINLITATADVSVVLRNNGAEPLRNIRVEIRLTSAQPGQDAALAALFAGPIERLFTAPFDLAPGEERTVRTLSTMARDAITVLQAGDRPMFVPVVAVRAAETGPDGERQAMAAYALGVERAGSEKLGPFWLDQPPRMYDNIGVRPHVVRG